MIRTMSIAPVAMLFSASMVSGQNASRIGWATFVDEAPTIDGFVDEAVWARAEPFTGFVQQAPIAGNPATERTEVRILYDESAIFIGVILYDSEPDEILVTDSRRDSGLGGMDSFQIIFDTYHDRQNGFVFGTNPAGIEYDGQVTNEGGGIRGGGRANASVGSGAGFNRNWDASWTVRTRVTDVGWTAEFEIPLSSLRYGTKPQVWGVNFQRNISRSREQLFWAPIGQVYNLYRLSQAGELRGLELEEPRNLKVTPYAVGSASRAYTNPLESEADLNGDFGFDAKYGVTPSLTLDLTYNTDFAQVEVDEQVVNLTRFNVRFPEKRTFFLENAGQFAAGKPGVDLFFSRRIGVDASTRAAVPILGGARMSGRAGDFNVAFLTMQTDRLLDEESVVDPSQILTPYNNFSMARVSRELPNRSSLGGIVVNRDAMGSGSASDDWNRTFGADGKLGLGQYTDLRGFISRTVTPGERGDEMAYNFRGDYRRGGLYLEKKSGLLTGSCLRLPACSRMLTAVRVRSAPMSNPITRLNAALESRYALERELGEGGMARVYLADDLKHERKVAVKVLKPELAAVVGAERFLAEIKTTANLTHPHILPLFDSGEADSFLFYVIPHIEGESLRKRIDREKQPMQMTSL